LTTYADVEEFIGIDIDLDNSRLQPGEMAEEFTQAPYIVHRPLHAIVTQVIYLPGLHEFFPHLDPIHLWQVQSPSAAHFVDPQEIVVQTLQNALGIRPPAAKLIEVRNREHRHEIWLVQPNCFPGEGGEVLSIAPYAFLWFPLPPESEVAGDGSALLGTPADDDLFRQALAGDPASRSQQRQFLRWSTWESNG
jgi:hypothetical protein